MTIRCKIVAEEIVDCAYMSAGRFSYREHSVITAQSRRSHTRIRELVQYGLGGRMSKLSRRAHIANTALAAAFATTLAIGGISAQQLPVLDADHTRQNHPGDFR